MRRRATAGPDLRAPRARARAGLSLSRRELLAGLAGTPLLAACAARAGGGGPPLPSGRDLDLEALRRAPFRIVPFDGDSADGLRLERRWEGERCRSRLLNRGSRAVRVREIVLFAAPHVLPPETALYGEGFQMLSQTGGTLGQPRALGDYEDAKHYRLPQPADATVVYGLVTLSPPGRGHRLLAFTSCRRFVGRFDLRPSSAEAVLEAEGRPLGPGETWELEELTFGEGPDRETLLGAAADRIAAHHPRLAWPAPPAGWCSWYCFGPRVTAADVLANLDVIAREAPALRYIQIDDGYQPAMGDWLETGPAFGGDVQGVLARIRERGFEPAIWVAPFIAEESSHLFQKHPDWFVMDEAGAPLRSDRVTFGGWRHGPWYALDGTHPQAQAHLESVFRTMRERWGCTYFKLDANFWGSLPGGRFHDPRATRVQAYRRGMEAVRRGAADAFLLGCNHPIWPSLGLVHGSRSSNDIKRTWGRVAGTARQNLNRNWQNGRLWWNDPDAVVLSGELTEDAFRFHATATFATGGMLLSGDDLTRLPPAMLGRLRRLAPPTGRAARFADPRLREGFVDGPDGQAVCLLNWGDAAQAVSVPLPGRLRVRDLWTDEDLGVHEGTLELLDLPPRSGRVLVLRRVEG